MPLIKIKNITGSVLWNPEGVILFECPLTRWLPELALGCSFGGRGKEDAGETGEAHPVGCSRRGPGPPGWPEEPAFRPPWRQPDGQWAQPVGQGIARIAGKQSEAWKCPREQWLEPTLNPLSTGSKSLEPVPREPDAQKDES